MKIPGGEEGDIVKGIKATINRAESLRENSLYSEYLLCEMHHLV